MTKKQEKLRNYCKTKGKAKLSKSALSWDELKNETDKF